MRTAHDRSDATPRLPLLLVPFWFRTHQLGCGVTALSLDEARAMLRELDYPREGEEILDVVVGVRQADLDQGHVVPNAGPLLMRGVWYPRHNL